MNVYFYRKNNNCQNQNYQYSLISNKLHSDRYFTLSVSCNSLFSLLQRVPIKILFYELK